MSTLTLAGVTRRFDSTTAVDDLSVVVPHGSLTAFLGPSGCGKTTLLRMIAGFLDPDEGTIAFDDTVVAGPHVSVPARKRRVGYVPQEGALFPHLDVATNVGFGLDRAERRLGRRGRSVRIGEMLDLVEIPRSFADRHPHELSGGQQQRVALARALAPRPSVVLLDEPFSSLDAALRESTSRAVAAALRAAGATGVLVTHDQDEALSLADQVAVMREGRLVQADSPQGLYRAPADPAVAQFVGGAALLPATLSGTTADCALGTLTLATAWQGGDGKVLVRPEQLRLTSNGTGPRATVCEVAFYGHDAAVHLELEGGLPLHARVPGAATPAVGSVVGVEVEGPVLAFPA
jgi:iron(III) transport system ATP-binding protein